MIEIDKILVPTDFSAMAGEAVEAAAKLAVLHDAALDIVYVFEEPAFPSFYGAGAVMLYGKVPDIKKQAESALEALAGEIIKALPEESGARLKLGTHLLEGHAADQICKFAEAQQTDLIVIPTHGLTGVRHVFLGSVAERVVREALCDVFVFKKRKASLSMG